MDYGNTTCTSLSIRIRDIKMKFGQTSVQLIAIKCTLYLIFTPILKTGNLFQTLDKMTIQ